MFGDLGKMMKIAAEMKRRMPEVQARIEASEYTAEAGGGAVRATVNGKLLLRDLAIGRELLDGGEAGAVVLADLVKEAVRAAQEKAAEAVAAAMRELTGGMNIPDMEGMM